MWEVEYTDEFKAWWDTLTEDQQDDLVVSVELLRNLGHALPRPHADVVKSRLERIASILRAREGVLLKRSTKDFLGKKKTRLSSITSALAGKC